MDRHHLRQILLLAPLLFLGSSSVLRAQPDFKGERRAPNPTVEHRRGARQPTINEKVEMALEQGNRARDKSNLDIAEKFYQKALAWNPKEARAYVGLGNVEMDYVYVPEDDDDSIAGHKAMERAEHEARKRAEGYYRNAVEINPKYYEAYMGLGFIYYLNSKDPSNYAKSEQAYRQAASLRPRDPEPHRSLGMLYQDRESDYSKAVAEYREAIRLATGKETILDTYLRLGGVLEKQEQYAEAVEAYRELIKLQFESGTAHFVLGRVYLDKLQKYAEAVEELKLAVKLNPKAPAFPPSLYEAYYKLGLSYVEAKNKAAAMEQYQNLRNAGQTAYAERLLAEINKQ